MPDDARLGVVVEAVVRRRAETARRLPLPREAHLARRCRVGVGVARVVRRRAPTVALVRKRPPGFDGVAVAFVVDALRRHGRGGGEDVATVDGVGAVRLVAAQIRNGRLHDDVRHVGDAEVAPVVHLAVLRDLRLAERTVVLAEELDRADEEPVVVGVAVAAKVVAALEAVGGKRIILTEAAAGGRNRRAGEERGGVVRCVGDGRHVVERRAGNGGGIVVARVPPVVVVAPGEIAGLVEDETVRVGRERERIGEILLLVGGLGVEQHLERIVRPGVDVAVLPARVDDAETAVAFLQRNA